MHGLILHRVRSPDIQYGARSPFSGSITQSKYLSVGKDRLRKVQDELRTRFGLARQGLDRFWQSFGKVCTGWKGLEGLEQLGKTWKGTAKLGEPFKGLARLWQAWAQAWTCRRQTGLARKALRRFKGLSMLGGACI